MSIEWRSTADARAVGYQRSARRSAQTGPWVSASAAAWRASDEGRIIGYITATTLTDIFYVSRRLAGLDVARQAVRTCLEAFEVCGVDREALERAEAMPGHDFEDNLQIACAVIANLDAIITRNKNDFDKAPTPALSPSELLAQLSELITETNPAEGQ